MPKQSGLQSLLQRTEERQTIKELEIKIQNLQDHNQKLIEALMPFAEYGPDALLYKDNQAFMGSASIKAGHFKKAYKLLIQLRAIK